MLEYTTPHTPQLNGVTERKFSFIKEFLLAMLLNAILNDTSSKNLKEKAIHKCNHVQNSKPTTGNKKSPFENFYGGKPKIIGSFS